MFHRLSSLRLLACLSLACSSPACAGEPLPGGAQARLGSAHFRAEGKLTALQLSADRRLLAGCDLDGVVYVWDRQSGKQLHRFDAHTRAAGLVFSPDGKRLAALNRVGEGAVWDLKRGRLLSRLHLKDRGGNMQPTQLRFTPDGKHLVFCIDPEMNKKPDSYEIAYHVYLADAATGRTVRHIASSDKEEPFRDAALSPDGRLVAILVENGQADRVDVRVVDFSGGVLHQTRGPKRKHWKSVTFTPDSKAVMLTNGDDFTSLDAGSGKEVRRLNHQEFFVPRIAGFDPGGSHLVAYQPSFSGEVFVWDVPSGKMVKSFKVLPNCPVVSDGRELLLAHGTVVLRWDLQTGKELSGGHAGHRGAVFGVAFSPDGKVLASSSDTAGLVLGSGDERTWLWDLETGEPLRSLPVQANVEVFSHDGRTLLTGRNGNNSDPALWDVQTGKKRWTSRSREPGSFLGATFTPNGREILWARRIDREHGPSRVVVERYDPASGRLLGRTAIRVSSAVWAAFSPDGSVLACDGGWRQSETGLRVRSIKEGALARLHDARTGKEHWSRPWANPGGIGIARFTPDGRRLLLGSWDGWLSLYEVATGQPAWRLGICRRDITAAVFSPDGRLLVTADNRLGVCSRFFTKKEWLAEARRVGFVVSKEVKGATALRVWPLPVGGKEPVILEWDGPRACSLALSADGRRLACGLSDGTVLLWDVRRLLRGKE